MADTPNDLHRRTPLYALHLELGGKMVPFAGYEMPVQYPAGVLREHLHTRAKAGLFDVSHMGQAFLSGNDPARALEQGHARRCRGPQGGHAALCAPSQRSRHHQRRFHGGAPDGRGRALSGRQCRPARKAISTTSPAKLKGIATLAPQPDRALLALQGPAAETVLARHAPETAGLTFMKIGRFMVAGAPAIVSRSGYTGEDGFEISIAAKDAERVARALLGEPEVLPIGLGARDSLRLEAGLCLYGHDMDETTDPITANLAWSIGKRRKMDRDFPAAEMIMGKLLDGTAQKRVGIRPDGRAPARDGTEIADKTGRVIGKITSGGFGPSLNAPVAMGYVDTPFAGDGNEIMLMVRGKAMPAHTAPMPFVPHGYKRNS